MAVSRSMKLALLVCFALVLVAECKKKNKVAAPPPALLSQPWGMIGKEIVAFFSQSRIYLNLAFCASAILLGPSKYVGPFVSEMIGSIVMVFFTFSPGPFCGHRGQGVEWFLHMIGVMIADWTCGGPHVNPGVTCAMFVWQKLSAAQALVHIAGQVAGGIIAFPALNGVGELFDAKIGGPEFVVGGTISTQQAAANEFVGSFVLLGLVFVICTTWFGDGAYDNTKKANLIYVRKQATFACGLRGVIYFCHHTGPAVNGMLATTWAFYKTGVFPRELDHYLVYWGAHCLGAMGAAVSWSAYTNTGMWAEPVEAVKVTDKKMQ